MHSDTTDHIDRHIDAEDIDALLPTEAECGDIREAFRRMETAVPDVDAEWERVVGLAGAVKEPARRLVWPRVARCLRIVAAAAACVAAVAVVRMGWRWLSDPSLRGTVVSRYEAPLGVSCLTDAAGDTLRVAPPSVDVAGSVALCGRTDAAAETDALSHRVLTMRTLRGEECVLRLSDGTKVWLTNESALTFPEAFEGKSREVRLTGEAYFEVAKDASRPFTVVTPYYRARVLGTSFAARACSPSDALVALVEGRVRVSAGSGGGSCVLCAGQTVRVGAGGVLSVADEDNWPYTQRRDGYFYFERARLSDVMIEVGRWYNKTVVFENEAAMNAELHFVASRREGLRSVLRAVSALSGVRVEWSDDDIIIR